MELSETQASIIQRFKRGEAASTITVFADDGARVGTLRPITAEMAVQHDLIKSLCRWRDGAMQSFLTVFIPSVEKTQAYLTRFSLPDPARILFLIENAAGEPVGNIGLCNVTTQDAELDNVVRGQKVDVPGFMRLVQLALVRWAMETLGVERVYLNVLGNNERAIASYKAVGFVDAGKQLLTREEIEGGYRLVSAVSGARVDAELVRMEISARTG